VRRDDGDALRRMLRSIRLSARYPLVFGGAVSGGRLQLTEFLGATTDGLRRLVVRPGNGAGGQALTGGRLVAVTEYRDAPTISHDYDRPVLAEGIRSVMAAPVVVSGVTRMVAYVATRTPVSWGNRARDDLAAAVDELTREIEVRDEVDRRLAQEAGAAASRELGLAQTAADVSDELRSLAAAAGGELAERLTAAAVRLSGSKPAAADAGLTRREREVLELVSYGLSYPDVARSLSLSPTTVKGYMQATMTKLEARSRHEAVVVARLRGILP
jgi:LuxR family transcriptional regulator, regulator of acetate metabolism